MLMDPTLPPPLHLPCLDGRDGLSKTLGKLSTSLLGLDHLQVGTRSIGVGNTLCLAKQVDVEAPLD